MTAAVIAAAIVLAAPQMPPRTARWYGEIIHREAATNGIDPLLVVAHVQVETRGTWLHVASSPTADWGLMQVHVSKTNYPEYLGREHLLFEPVLNFKLGIKLMRFWRGYHKRMCKRGRHLWYGHMKYGYRVRSPESGRRVQQVYRSLALRLGRV